MGKTFIQQLELMSNTDVLISPHGAQLSTIPFMPDCGCLLEIMPYSYWFPGYFQALAKNSGLIAAWQYPFNSDPRKDTPVVAKGKRNKKRSDAKHVPEMNASIPDTMCVVQ